jgi:glutamine amidotransferase
VPDDSSIIATRTDYASENFASSIESGALLACQFHPEKSQDAGLRLIGNFLGL